MAEKCLLGNLSFFLGGEGLADFRDEPAVSFSECVHPSKLIINHLVKFEIFHQPRFPWNKGISLPQLAFGVRVTGEVVGGHTFFLTRSIPSNILKFLAQKSGFCFPFWMLLIAFPQGLGAFWNKAMAANGFCGGWACLLVKQILSLGYKQQ